MQSLKNNHKYRPTNHSNGCKRLRLVDIVYSGRNIEKPLWSTMRLYPADVSLVRCRDVDKLLSSSTTSEHLSTVYDKLWAGSIVSSIFQMISAFRSSAKRTIEAQNCAIFHRYSRWLGKANKVTSNASHVVFHSIRQTLAHTNDIEINWCNDKNSCLATVRGENPPLQFQALHLAWHVMWSQLSLRKTNPFFPLFYIQV